MVVRLCYGWTISVTCATLILLIPLIHLDLDEPAAVDDAHISADTGIGLQPPDRPSVMVGFVAAVRLHMILEQT